MLEPVLCVLTKMKRVWAACWVSVRRLTELLMAVVNSPLNEGLTTERTAGADYPPAACSAIQSRPAPCAGITIGRKKLPKWLPGETVSPSSRKSPGTFSQR